MMPISAFNVCSPGLTDHKRRWSVPLGWSMGVLLNQFQEHASGGGGMDKDVSMAAGARAGLVEQPRAAGLEAGDGGFEVRHAQGDVMQSGPAFFEEPGDGRIGGGWFEQFDARVSGREHGDIHPLGDDSFAMGDGQAKGLVEGDGLLQGCYSDAEVVDGGGGTLGQTSLSTRRKKRALGQASQSQGGDQLGDAFAFGGYGAEDGAGEAFGVEFQLHAVGAGMVALVDDEDIGDLHDAGFDGLDIVTQDP